MPAREPLPAAQAFLPLGPGDPLGKSAPLVPEMVPEWLESLCRPALSGEFTLFPRIALFCGLHPIHISSAFQDGAGWGWGQMGIFFSRKRFRLAEEQRGIFPRAGFSGSLSPVFPSLRLTNGLFSRRLLPTQLLSCPHSWLGLWELLLRSSCISLCSQLLFTLTTRPRTSLSRPDSKEQRGPHSRPQRRHC